MNEPTKRIIKIVRRDIKNLQVSFGELKKRAPWLFDMNNPSQIEFIRDNWDVWTTDEILDHLKGEIDCVISEFIKNGGEL